MGEKMTFPFYFDYLKAKHAESAKANIFFILFSFFKPIQTWKNDKLNYLL